MKKIYLLLAMLSLGAFNIFSQTEGKVKNGELFISGMLDAALGNQGPAYITEATGFYETPPSFINPGQPLDVTVQLEVTDNEFTGLTDGTTAFTYDGITLGIRDNTAAGANVKSVATDGIAEAINTVGLTGVGDQFPSYYTSPEGNVNGIDQNINGAFNISVVAEALNTLPTQPSTLQSSPKYYMGELTYTFSTPVNYPIIHMTGLGAILKQTNFSPAIELVWNTEYELLDGLTMTMLSASPYTELTNGTNVQSTWNQDQYQNDGAFGTDGDQAGTGSFRIDAIGITEVKFAVYVQGKNTSETLGGPNGGANWSIPQQFNNDRHTHSWTITTYDFGGVVVIDDDRDGTTQTDVDITTDAIPTTLNAVLVDSDGNVAQVQPVSATDGTFTFVNAGRDDYVVVLTTESPTIGDSAPSPNLPSGWFNAEESFDGSQSNGSDSNANGVTDSFMVNSTTVLTLNEGGNQDLVFGISQNTILPIELAYFTADAVEADAVLDWGTFSEEDNSHFVVERSIDGVEFEEILEVESKAVDGNSETALDYTITDKGIGEWLAVYSESQVVYYRIKQIDLDGTVNYPTAVRPVSFTDLEIEAKMFPNPVTAGVSTTVQMMDIEKVEVYTMDGQLVKVIEEPTPVKGTSIATGDLAKGMYMVIVNGKQTMKLVVK